jgi:hypothetical protein
MGLKIHSIAELPDAAIRGYYVYLLDYGWEEPLGRTLRDNFDKMADLASRNNAAVFLGLNGSEFNDEVLSWHGVNGADADELLPAVLITNKHPSQFMGMHGSWNHNRDHLVLIPLRTYCKTPTDVVRLIEGIFNDIKAKKPLANFSIVKEERAGVKGAILDAIILQPTIGGVGVDLKSLLRRFKKSVHEGA